ncbi:MAG: 2-hydroxyacid dehydrogenase [Proteobacteria bacterium]|nr:2-hydroxyacid dehydrogenase [Pseudomonadota bacterium]
MSERLTVMLAGDMGAPWKPWLEDHLTTDWNILTWAKDEPFERFAELIVAADAIAAGPVRGDWPAVPKLRLYNIPFTGYEWLDTAILPKTCAVCNGRAHEIAMAEFIMATMIEREIGFCADDRNFRRDNWTNLTPGIGPAHGEIHGKTLGIIGHGLIGREVAKRADAFGMRVVGISRSAPPDIAPLAWFGGMGDMDRLLAESDVVLMALPLNDETTGLFDAACFAKMKPDAIFMNVGRGPIVDEEVLYNALKDRQIRSAVIDVWYQYPTVSDPNPRPSRFPFWELDNVLMSPHVSARTEETRVRRWVSIARNLDALARGEALENVCFYGTGKQG